MMMMMRTSRYTRTDPFVRFSRDTRGSYHSPTSTMMSLKFTKILDYVRRRTVTREADLEEYIYGSNLDEVVVVDCVVKEHRLYYCSESEDDDDVLDASEAKRVSVRITLAVKVLYE